MPPKRVGIVSGSTTVVDAKKKKVGAVKSADDTEVPIIRWEIQDPFEENERGKWHIHAANDDLNAAVKKGWNTVNIKNYNEPLFVKLEIGQQQLKNSGFTNPIRLSFLDQSSNDYFIWEYREVYIQKRGFSRFRMKDAICLESAYIKKLNRMILCDPKDEAVFIVYLSSMTMRSENSDLRQTIRRVKSDASTVPVPFFSTPTLAGIKSSATGCSTSTSASGFPSGDHDEVKTVVIKGKAPVDPFCFRKIGKAHVYYEGNVIYDVMLNQTNLEYNNNKFYLIQLLEDDSPSSKSPYNVWLRWGRVGCNGQMVLCECENLFEAKSRFECKFFLKTDNEWRNRDSFEKFEGKYDLVKVDYNLNEVEKHSAKVAAKRPPTPECKLDPRLKALIELICDVNAMEQAVVEMKYDSKRAPLGKLTVEQIKAGYEALKEIDEAIDRNAGNRELIIANNSFYTRIPHSSGRRRPPIISTKAQVREKMQLLEALGDIQVAIKMLNEAQNELENPFDCQYKGLECEMYPIDKNSVDYKIIEKYLLNTHENMHNSYTMELVDVFECNKKGESDKFVDHGNRMLLWHGSRLTNWAGILKKGLCIAPPEAPVSGYMFGKGVYFADRSSKSANYCFSTPAKNIGLLLLCEVSLGNCNKLRDCDYDAGTLLSPNCHSVMGLGRAVPDETKNHSMSDGTVVPIGPSKIFDCKERLCLNYNEYVIYNTNQIKMRYLVKTKFTHKTVNTC